MGYEDGLAAAFVIWLVNTIRIVAALNSRMQRNLAKVGQRLSWVSLRPVPLTKSHRERPWWLVALLFAAFSALGLISVLLSWLYVAWVLGSLAYQLMKDRGAPVAIREFRWKLRNVELSLDDMVRELMKVSGDDPSRFEQVRAEVRQLLAESA